jgi:hypothetical protein
MSKERTISVSTTTTMFGAPRRCRLALLGVISAAVLCLLAGALAPVSAHAALVREGTFGSFGEGAGQIGEEVFGNTLAVDQGTGDVYVADKGNNRIDKFDASGKFLMAWGYGVADGTTNAPQTCTTTCFKGIRGTKEGQFYQAMSIAVDSSGGLTDGDVYAVNNPPYPGKQVVQRFTAEGVYLGKIEGGTTPQGEFEEVEGLSVDTSGNLWVGDRNANRLDEFDSSGAYVTQLTASDCPQSVAVDSAHLGGQAYYSAACTSHVYSVAFSGSPSTLVDGGSDTAIAVDPVTGKLYVDRGYGSADHTVAVYDDAHNLLETFPTEIVESNAMAYGHAAGQLYVYDAEEHRVVIFKEYIPGPPLVMSESTFRVMKDSATLQAKLNPLGTATTYHFEYGTSASYGASTPESGSIGSDFKPYDVSAALPELQAGTVYHFRVVATNTAGTTYGPDETFKTANGFFSFVGFDGVATNPDGSLQTQAGAHPDAFTVRYRLDVTHDSEGHTVVDGGIAKDIEVNLPPGFIGNATAVPQCSTQDFLTGDGVDFNQCPDDTAVGFIRLYLGGVEASEGRGGFPVYNLTPPPGTVAEFGFPVLTTTITMTVSVRTGGDNGLRVTLHNLPQALQITGTDTTFWGVPSDPSHDSMRGHCIDPVVGSGPRSTNCHTDLPPKALLTLPTLCSEPLMTTIRADSWDSPGSFAKDSFTTHDEGGSPLPFTGCERLGFEPSIKAAPDTSRADTPAGLTVGLKVNQSGLLSTTGIAPSDIQNTEVRLPEGVVINPGQAAGLVACQPGEDGIGTENKPSCPAASKVGNVVITTPLLPDKLEGPVYILPSDPPHLRLLVAPSGDSVNLKLIGDVYLDPVTGRLTSKFEGTPPLPFTDLQLSFSGGAQAALATPAKCGVYSTVFDFTPWSSPFGPDVRGSDSFAIDAGPGGSACASPLPFAPSMIAGSTTDQAAGFTNFSLLLQRGDGQQRIAGLQFKTPPGLLGVIRGVTLCGAGEAASGDCPSGSQIGHVVVGAGPGPYPLYVPEAGRPPAPIYLTGPYKGAPYGLSIVVPVIAGPFDLGRIVVRSAISVDHHTSQLTVSTDPLPTIVAGVPVDLRTINTVIDRPGFMFNPTSCAPMSFSGIASSVEGSTAPISTHFQVGSCQTLKFKPNFQVSTNGHTSRRNGASLDARIVYPSVAPGNNQASSQSNIAKVKVDLPRQLPSRLTTLQKACPDATFSTNPDKCPKASRVGYAKAVTPVLPGALTGPAYFVSHGGAAFPDLIVVLQGQGIRVDLVGSTFISKQGITSSTFQSVPDVPIYTFELYLPQGRDSALAANGDLCKSTLRMPTMFQAQDGQVIHQNTPIAVTGCGQKAHHARKRHNGRKARHASTAHKASSRSASVRNTSNASGRGERG